MTVSKVAFGLFAWLAICVPTYSEECPFPKDADATTLISYLQVHQSTESNSCIDESFAELNRLLSHSDLTYEQVLVLIRFLDHRRLPSASEQKGFETHFPTPAEQYPAITSIFLIGPRAIKPLLSALGMSQTVRFRECATLAWSLIYRDDPVGGVRALLQAASLQNDRERVNNLRIAAVSAAHNCPEDVRERCASELTR